MKIVFAGTPEFAAASLAALIAAGHEIPLVLTQPDRPAGRGMQLHASAVKQLALQHRIEVLQPLSLRKGDDGAAAVERLRSVAPDLMVVAAYGLILPQLVLDIPAHGCINVHASLLPRWRGAAPIHRAIQAGDTHTGITIMQMEAGLDTGPMRLVQSIEIFPSDTTATLHDRLAHLGGSALVQALELLSKHQLPLTTQPLEGVTYAHKIEKTEAPLVLTQPATLLANQVRAFDPFPGCTIAWPNDQDSAPPHIIKVWAAQACTPSHQAVPGTVLAIHADGIEVACGQDSLLITQLQRAGGKRQSAAQLAATLGATVGMRLT